MMNSKKTNKNTNTNTNASSLEARRHIQHCNRCKQCVQFKEFGAIQDWLHDTTRAV